ncbi:antirestriction protein [Enterobacter ludwigii]|uniref:antirestriction protein n=1 Tax=Enterobacter ludwigii TaxID=299767 RepID=UPI0039753070
MNQTVTCDVVRLESAQRLTFLPDLFGGDFMTSEASLYAYAQRYCLGYQGGFWQFYRLPDGGGYMAPDVESLTLCNPAYGPDNAKVAVIEFYDYQRVVMQPFRARAGKGHESAAGRPLPL